MKRAINWLLLIIWILVLCFIYSFNLYYLKSVTLTVVGGIVILITAIGMSVREMKRIQKKQ